jgi:hypothetical protein
MPNEIKPVIVQDDGINRSIKPVIVADDGINKLKKKEVSQSTPKQKVTSSVTSKTAQKQPSVSSGEAYNWNGQDYVYRNNKWEETALFEGNKSVPQSQKSAFKKVTDRNKIKQLNYQFKKDVSLDPIDQVYSNYDEEKKDNEYRVNNNNWERKLPGSNSWNVITNEGSVSALNRRYSKNVKYTPELKLKKQEPKLVFADVNTSLVSKTEEDAVGTLSKKYGKYGFSFEQSGFGTDYVTVYNKDKSKEITIGFDEKNPEEALKLKTFLEQNASQENSSAYDKIKEKKNVTRDYENISAYDSSKMDQSKKKREKELSDYLDSEEYNNDFKSLSYDEMKEEVKDRISSLMRWRQTDPKMQGDLDKFYKTEAYKIYKQKKKEEFGARDERIDLLYTELQTAKASGNKSAVKNINSKITAYLTDDVIQDQVKNYSIQLNDLDNSAKKLASDQKKYLQSVEEFNSRAKSGQMTQEEFDQNKKMLDDQAESLSTRADFLMSSGKSIQNNQKKLNVVAGKYVTEKSKAGGFFGGVVNSLLIGVSKSLVELPLTMVASSESSKKYDYNMLSPEEKQFYKDKGYSEKETKNILSNERIKDLKQKSRKSIIDITGSDQTTKEYMKSKDRGFFEKAIYGVAESTPAMFMGTGGYAASFTGLAAQSYSSIEDEMLDDPDFKTTSVKERAIVTVPYSLLMGVLENYGLKNVVKGQSFSGGVVKNILTSSIKKMPKGASREVLQSIMDKEVKNLIAKGSLKIINGAIAEFETGATQSLVLDIGLKSLYNKLSQSGMTEEEVNKLSGGEMFATPDSAGEIASTVLEDGLAEAVGGATIGTFTTVASGLMNGNISLYNEEDLDYLKEISQDSNFKKIIVANLKTEMLKGNLTKSEAQERLDSMNELSSVIESIPDGLTKEDQIDAVNMLSEKNRLTREIQGKDPALVTAQTERINEINEELKTISKNAVKESTKPVEEVTAEGGGVQYQGVEEGQPEIREGEGPVRETAQPETDLGNRPIEGRGVQEEVNKLRGLFGEAPKFQKGEQTPQAPEVDSVVEEMNAMPEDVAKFDVPSDLTTKNKTNVGSLVKRFGDKLKSTFKGGVIKNISEYNGIPMIFTISDQLTSGNVKNEFTGNTIDVNGGIGFNLTEGNENSAWANTDKKEAEGMLSRAQDVYSKNKDLFDRLWSEGKLPQGQVPMAIVKMGQDSIQTNEALFRFAADTIRKKFNKKDRANSLNGLIEDISAVNPESKVISFIKENNFKTIDELLDNMNNLKPIGERTNVTRFLFTGGIQLNKETKPGKPRSKSALALVGDKDSSYYKYIHLQTINNAIQDESTKEVPSNHIIGITGVDVLNPSITNPKHRNYPYGVKGGLIGILESPVHAADVFPEMYSKSFYLNKEDKAGKLPSPSKAVDQSIAASGPVAGIKAFRGAKISVKMTEIQKLLGKLRLAFPSVTVVDTQEEFNSALENPDVKQFVKDGEVVYGFTKDGKVFLNPNKANSNTAIHEFSHIWMNFLKENNPKLLAKGYSLLEGTEVLKRKIAELGDVELAREEALAELIANKGETLIEAGKKSKFKNWLNAVFTYVKSKFKAFDKLTPEQFQDISLNEFIDGSLASLLGGKEITSKEIKNIDVLFSKGRPKEAVDIVIVARDNGISDAAIKQYLKEEGFSEQAIKDAFKIQPKSPSVAKVLGKPKAKKVTVNEMSALKDQIRLEAKAAREAKGDLNAKRKALATAISGMVKTGKIKATQAATLIKRISNLNLDNPVMVERFVNYAERVFERADYQETLSKAFETRKSIRKLLKTDNQAEVVGMAKEFTKIDPSMVEDIDAYLEIAEKVKNAVKPSRTKGEEVVLKQAANISQISEYSKKEIERQEQIKADEFFAAYNEVEGLSKDMSLKEMKDIINSLKEDSEANPDKQGKVMDFLKEKMSKTSDTLQTMLKTGIDPMTGEEIAFDEKQKDLMKRVLKIDLNEMSVRDAIKIVESLENFITNQITSGLEAAVSSYEGAMNVKSLVNRGKKAKSLRLFFSNYVGKIYSEQLFSLPMLMEKMFGGVTNSLDVMNKMGLIKLVNGVNKANRQHNDILDQYSKQPFYSTKNALGRYVMNKGFMDAENVYERGMLAFLKRNLVGSPAEMKAEFERRVRMIQESINKLTEDGDPKEQKMGELYQKIYDKLGVSEMDMDVINANASKNNLDAVNWWVNQWSQHYSDLSDISLSVYNTQLGSDLNYTPDKYKKLSSENQSLDEGAVERNGAFAISIDYTDKNKTGVLMETTRPNAMPDGRYISLDFDTNNSKALKSALTDINTASAIRQVDGFINSKSFKKLIPESEDRSIMTKRINTYIRRAKGKSIVASDTIQYLNKLVNFATALGVGKALGGINQAVSQTIPVMVNTIVNAGRFDFAGADFNTWLDKSGLPISNRGLESQSTVDSIDRKIDMKGTGVQEALKSVTDLNQWYLKQFLVRPDVFVARSSFKSYYLQNLKRRGLSTDIDWNTHEIDMDAAEYAQAMIDRQQNISDPMLAGEFLSSDDPIKQIARKVILPFASFILNQKARMYNDMMTISSKTTSRQDKIIAYRSLTGLATELATYQMIGFGIRRLYDMIAASLLGDEDDEETKKKKIINATKYPIKSIVNDIFSPIPMTDGITTWGLNQALAQYPWMTNKEIKDAIESRNKVLELKGESNMTEAEEKEFIAKIKEEATYQVFEDEFDRSYGMIGIAGSTYQELGEIGNLATTGEFTDEYQGRETTKKLLESDREKVKYAVPFMIAYSTGLLPKDVGSIGRNYVNRIKKKAITEKQFERYDAVQKDLGRNLKSWEVELVKTKKESETAVDEVKFIERNGGLTERQGREYLKLMKAIGEPSVSDIVRIKEGQTADQILK